MITVIRRSFKTKAFKIFLWTVILTVGGVFGLIELFNIGNKVAWIAKVNKEHVAYADFVRKAEAHQEQLIAFRSQYGESADLLLQAMGLNLDPKVFALDSVIQDALLNQAVREFGIDIDPDYVILKLANPLFVREYLADLIPLGAYDRQGNVDPVLLQQYFHRIGLSMHDFQNLVAQTLQRQLLMQIVAQASYMPEFVLKERFIAEHSQKKFSILTLSLADALQAVKNKPVSENALQSFFDQQNELSHRYVVATKRGGVAWSIDASTYGITVSAQEIDTYYEDNKAKLYVLEAPKIKVRHILFKVTNAVDRESALTKAKNIRAELLKNPNHFEAKAKENGMADGGLLPAFSRGTHELAFDKAAFTLKENGDISEIITTKDGYELLQRVERIPASYKSLQSVEKEIKNTLMQQKFSEQFMKEMRTLGEQVYGSESSLAKLMQEKGAKKQNIEPVTRDNKEWGPVLFGLHQKDDLDAYVDKGVGFVVQLTKIQDAHTPSLSSIKDEVTRDYYEEQAQKELDSMLQKAYAQAKERKDLKDLEQMYHGKLETTSWIAKDKESVADLRKKGIPVNRLFQLENVGSVISSLGERDAYIMRLDAIEPFNQEAFEAKKDGLLNQEEMRLYIMGFVASLFRNAKIETNETINEFNSPTQYED